MMGITMDLFGAEGEIAMSFGSAIAEGAARQAAAVVLLVVIAACAFAAAGGYAMCWYFNKPQPQELRK